MKTKFLKPVLLLIILFSFYNCCEDCENNLKNCENNLEECKVELADLKSNANVYVKKEDTFLELTNKTVDLYLPYILDSSKKFKPVHLDLIEQFGLNFKTITDKNGKVSELKIMLQEIDGKLDYDLVSARYSGKNIDNNNKIVHNFDIVLTKGTTPNDSSRVDISKGLTIKSGELIDLHINDQGTFTNQSLKTRFGNTFCKAIVVKTP